MQVWFTIVMGWVEQWAAFVSGVSFEFLSVFSYHYSASLFVCLIILLGLFAGSFYVLYFFYNLSGGLSVFWGLTIVVSFFLCLTVDDVCAGLAGIWDDETNHPRSARFGSAGLLGWVVVDGGGSLNSSCLSVGRMVYVLFSTYFFVMHSLASYLSTILLTLLLHTVFYSTSLSSDPKRCCVA